MSPIVRVPADDGDQFSDDELAEELDRSDLAILIERVEDLKRRIESRWDPDAIDEADRNARADVRFVDYDRHRLRPDGRPPLDHMGEWAGKWLAAQDASTRRLVAAHDYWADKLDAIVAADRAAESAERARLAAEQQRNRAMIEAKNRGQEDASGIEGGADAHAPLWDLPRLITTDFVPRTDDEAPSAIARLEVVVLAFDETHELLLITGSFLEIEDLTAMVKSGLKAADDGAVARTLGTTRLEAARILSWLNREVYVYDHAYWAGDAVGRRRSRSRSSKPPRVTVADEITLVLADEPKTVAAIASAIGRSEPAVLLALKRGPFVRSDERPARWTVSGAQAR